MSAAAEAGRPACQPAPAPWDWGAPLVPLGLVVGLAADLAQPLSPLAGVPLAGVLALGFALLLALCLALRRRYLAGMVAGLLLGLSGPALAQWAQGGPRGWLAAQLPAVAAWQATLLHLPPPAAWPEARLRAALATPDARPRPFPGSADEHLFNALLLDARGDRRGAAMALVAALARRETPRPDALLLHAALMTAPEARPILAEATLPPAAAALLAALQLRDATDRITALDRILANLPAEDATGDDPAAAPEPADAPVETRAADRLVALAALAHARIAATLPEGPTVAQAARIAPTVEAFAEAARFADFESQFLDPARARHLREGLAALDWVREVASRRLSVTTLAPPPGLADQPLLLRLQPPEPARSVQLLRNGTWVEVPREAGVPTLRLPRPFAPQRLALRYLDRHGVAAEALVHDVDPAAMLRARAQQALRRQGPFGLYQPGWTAPGQLNPLPIAGWLRAGLDSIVWWTDSDPTPRQVPVAVPDDVLLEGDPARILVEFAAPEDARLLWLVALYADGSRSETLSLPIR